MSGFLVCFLSSLPRSCYIVVWLVGCLVGCFICLFVCWEDHIMISDGIQKIVLGRISMRS